MPETDRVLEELQGTHSDYEIVESIEKIVGRWALSSLGFSELNVFFQGACQHLHPYRHLSNCYNRTPLLAREYLGLELPRFE